MSSRFSLVALVTLAACGGSGDSGTTPPPPPPGPAPVASVSVALSTSSLAAGQTASATAVLRDASGTTLSGRSISWASSAPAVATVSAAGAVTAVAPGTAQITATSEGQTGSATLTVTPVPVASVTVALGASTLQAGTTTQASAALRDAAGGALSGRDIAWSSSATAVATVSAAGVVTAVAPGSATITATSEGRSGSATLTVTVAPVATVVIAPGATSIQEGTLATLTATLRDERGAVLTGRDIVWRSSNADVAIVSTTGLVAGLLPGTATITATSEGRVGSAQVTVTPLPVASVVLFPPVGTLVAGTTDQFAVELRAANNTVLTGRLVTWSSSDPGVAIVSSAGVVAALSPGIATIRATSEGITGVATLLVVAPPSTGFSLTFRNLLIAEVDVYLNGLFWRRVAGQSSTQGDFGTVASLTVRWELVRPTLAGRQLGEPITESFATVTNPSGGYVATADNVLGNGDAYFTPVLANSTNVDLLIDMPERFLASRCECFLPSNRPYTHGFGYWRLGVLPTVDAYRASDTFRTGPRSRVSVFSFQVEAGSGVFRKQWLLWP